MTLHYCGDDEDGIDPRPPHVFGHRVKWVYADTGEDVGAGDTRPCPKCGRLPNPDGTDPCLARLPGILAACCGHGAGTPYVITEDGVTVEGWANIVKLLPPEARAAYLAIYQKVSE
jgi:hypothetical protein